MCAFSIFFTIIALFISKTVYLPIPIVNLCLVMVFLSSGLFPVILVNLVVSSWVEIETIFLLNKLFLLLLLLHLPHKTPQNTRTVMAHWKARKHLNRKVGLCVIS